MRRGAVSILLVVLVAVVAGVSSIMSQALVRTARHEAARAERLQGEEFAQAAATMPVGTRMTVDDWRLERGSATAVATGPRWRVTLHLRDGKVTAIEAERREPSP